ncbi:Cytochrome b561/ferric reductase transmembrane [Dillenia turbinata]|uniref:Cytochrome b561 and DOMON domain-containing protein n=1 Tax=Dillenia turbinata TaxID=194707 RepID=A0AAN8UUH8_9MAGN
MTPKLTPIFCLSIFLSIYIISYAQTCSNYVFSNNQVFSSCTDLPVLSSFLHWTYDPSSGTAKIAYRHTGVTTSKWVAWAINPTEMVMVGSQALVAYQKSNGSMRVYTSPISGYDTKLQDGTLSFSVTDLSATYANNEITIFATVEVPNNGSNLYQVWQDGPVSNDNPQGHDRSGSHLQSTATLNFVSGGTSSGNNGGRGGGSSSSPSGGGGNANSRTKRKNVHGVLNALSWGTLMPIGAIIARYMKVFKSADPAWFYLHVACQSSAYIIGVAGWGTGLKLGSETPGLQYTTHRNIGITLFVLGTLQVLALFLRPKKDYKYRHLWNIYHHSVGYLVILLSSINIFKGLHILNPEEKWKHAYITILVLLVLIAAGLEAFTWFVVLKKKRDREPKLGQVVMGTSELNNYGARPV